MKFKSNAIVVLLLLACAAFFSCNVRQVEEPVLSSGIPVTETSSLLNSSGVSKNVFSPYETVFLSLDNLWAGWETAIEVVRLSDNQIIRRLVIITDIDGKITNIPVWYNVGVGTNGYRGNEAGDYTVHIQQTNPNKPLLVVNVPFKVLNAMSGLPSVWASKADGSYAFSTALIGSAVYVQGAGFAPGSQVKLLVVTDKTGYNAGDVLVDQTGVIEQVTVQADGSLPNTLVWANAVAGSYDVIADATPFGQFGSGDAAGDVQLTGLLVHSTPAAGDIIADIACNSDGIHQNTFSCLDPIYAQVDPMQRPKNASELAAVYIVAHRDSWKAGDILIDVETVGATEMALNCLVNPISGSLALTLLRGQSKTSDGQPVRLWPGNYDVIVDIGRDGKYTPGTDILDGGSQVGLTITCDPSTEKAKLIVGAESDFLSQYQTETQICALLLDQDGKPITGVPVTFKVESGYCAIAGASGITDADGKVCTKLYGISTWGGWLIIKTVAVVNGVTYTEFCSIWKEVPYTHNTGIIVGN